MKLSPAGAILARFGAKFLITPVKVALDAAGNLWVTEHHRDRIAKLSPTGQLLATYGKTGTGPGAFQGPNGIAVDAQGNVYVADHFNNRVQKLSPAGQPLAQWVASEAADFGGPYDVAVDTAGNTYVSGDGHVTKLSTQGVLLTQWSLGDPRGLALDSQGDVYVGDAEAGRITELSPGGDILAHWGSPGTAPGQIVLPADVALDPAGNVYVAEGDPEDGTTCTCRVQKFSPTGALLAVWR